MGMQFDLEHALDYSRSLPPADAVKGRENALISA
jgi:hypothetical protein